MRRIPLILTFLLLGGVLVAGLVLPQFRTADSSRLDESFSDFLEDEHTGRRLAHLHGVLERRGDCVILRMHVTAVGPRVEAVPSFRGVHGANHVTARDLTDLVASDRLKVLAMPAEGTTKRFGRIEIAQRGRIPERRMDGEGRLVLGERSEEFLLGITAHSPELGPGRHDVYLEARGVPRLRIDVRVGADRRTGAILGVHSLSGHHVESDR